MQVDSYSLLLIASWLPALWISGWLMLPAVRLLFPSLPDGGLAAGRLLLLLASTLLSFWLAIFHLIPLTFSGLGLAAFPILLFGVVLWDTDRRREFWKWVNHSRRNLLVSDLVFLFAFAFFILLRLWHPEIRGQEKPMDSAIIGVLSRSAYLPAQDPWFSGVSFTNYYYFGHLMAAQMVRVSGIALPYAYNLIQATFCALFLSLLWPLCAALTSSRFKGLLVMATVALCGNYEPLRQWYFAWQSGGSWWPLDWWSTSRVVPFTINEYPFFTLTLGDAHAHFFALPIAVLIFCLCYQLCDRLSTPSAPRTRFAFYTLALVFGALVMTNSWDVPIYLLLVISLLLHTKHSVRTQTKLLHAFGFAVVLLGTCAPFLWQFHSPVKGATFELWNPGWPILLIYAPFCFMACCLFVTRQAKSPLDWNKFFGRQLFRLFLMYFGAIAMLAPCFFYINGHFGGDYRHQDTVFKFGLQAWLLLSISLGCIFFNLSRRKRHVLLFGAFWIIPLFCSAVLVAAKFSEKNLASTTNSLNGARYLSSSEQAALVYLSAHAKPGDTLLEAVGANPDGSPLGAYSDYARFSTLSGIPCYLGWSQHAAFWGVPQVEIQRRWQITRLFYGTESFIGAVNGFLGAQRENSPTFILRGDLERSQSPRTSNADFAKQRNLRMVWANGDVAIYAPLTK